MEDSPELTAILNATTSSEARCAIDALLKSRASANTENGAEDGAIKCQCTGL